MSQSAPVITLDGPAGAGKGTISRLLAARLGWSFLDSGALYRLVALAAQKRQKRGQTPVHRGLTPLLDEAVLADVALHLDARFTQDTAGEPVILLAGEVVGTQLRTESCGDLASKVAAMPAVRAALLERQRAFAQPPGLVADGRDMGTVVFPEAPLKVFLTASVEERARRRHKQLMEQGLSASIDDLLGEIAERDRRDSERKIAPLKPAEDALILDCSDLSIEAVISELMHHAEQAGLTERHGR